MKISEKEMEREILWEDTKRYAGLPLSFTKYSVDNERLYIESGLLTTEENEVLLYRVLDIKSSRTLWQKMFDVGTITLYNADKSDSTVKLENIKDPVKVKRFLSDLIEKQRKANGVAGREIVGSNGCTHDGIEEQDG